MHNITRRRLLQGAGAVGALGLIGTQSVSAGSRDPLDRHLVGVEPGKARIATREADEVYRVLDFANIGQAVSGWYPDDAIEGLRNNPNVRYIEAEGEMHAHDQEIPWGVDRVKADVVIEDDDTDAAGSEVAVIDTGIDPEHETLEVEGGKAFVDCRPGWCAEDWDDDEGHGTHVGGTAAAVDNATGVVGVAPEVGLYAVKVLDSRGSGTWSDVAAGIEWTADEGIEVGNLSLGGGHSETVQDAVEYAHDKGTLLVSSAGNDGPDEDSVSYPAAYDETLAVSATDQDDDITSWSSRGEEVDIAAPGADVLSTYPDDEYETLSGTSMSAPHVAGGAAHLMADGLNNDEAAEHLQETAEDIGLDDTEQGAGLLDVAAALEVEHDDDEHDDEEDEDDEDDEIEESPEINKFDVSTRTTGPWNRANVEWEVSDPDGALDDVTSELLDSGGEVLDKESSNVSGDTASGEHELRSRDDPAEVRLTVSNEGGNETTETKDY